MSHIANKIDAEDKNLGDLLHNKRFRIDVFQREYKWGKKQMEDLINDVTGSFLKCYSPNGELSDYDNYDCYYMGPVVLCRTNKDISIIDGQQRLTSFSLLLIYLYHLATELGLDTEDTKNLNEYIFVRKGGTKTLVLNIEHRKDVMYGLMEEEGIEDLLEDADRYELSNRNILERYADIREMFPRELKDQRALQVFIDWLLEKVIFVQINAYSMDNAYTIFETMNDRGLNLSPSEILKGFLLSKIIEGKEDYNTKADIANDFWNGCISIINKTLNYENSDLDFFKAWFRAKYAETKRQSKAGSENEDFELIGTQFHSWVKNNTSRMNLRTNDDFFYFIKSDLEFYSRLYLRVSQLKRNNSEGFEAIYSNSFFTIADSLYYTLMLAPISKLDDIITINDKIRTVGRFVERYSNMRLLQNKSISQSVIRNNIYDLVKVIRNLDLETLKKELNSELDKLSTPLDFYHLRIYNGMYSKYLIGEITHRAYSDIGEKNPIDTYMPSRRKNAYIMAHIQDDNTDGNLEPIDNSEIANCVLIPRQHLEEFRAIRSVRDRVDFLTKRGYTPEMPPATYDLEEFFMTRQKEFGHIIESLFFYEL